MIQLKPLSFVLSWILSFNIIWSENASFIKLSLGCLGDQIWPFGCVINLPIEKKKKKKIKLQILLLRLPCLGFQFIAID